MMRILIVIAGLLLAGCSAFSAPGKLVEYHNRVGMDQQIEKWSRGDAHGAAGVHTQPVWDNR